MSTTSAEAADAALHQRVDELIASTGLDDVASITDVLTAVAQRRGRTVELQPLPADLAPGELFGLCLPYPDRDVILFRTGAGAEHELHSTLHESGHLLLGHVAVTGQTAASQTRAGQTSEGQADRGQAGDGQDAGGGQGSLARLLPDLDPALIAGALARSSYEDEQERAAELFAMKVRAVMTAAQRRRGDAILRRFDDALG